MKQIIEIILHTMMAGTNVYVSGQISVPWNNGSFWLNNYVEFHIICQNKIMKKKFVGM